MNTELLRKIVDHLKAHDGELVEWTALAKATGASATDAERCLRAAVKRGEGPAAFGQARRPWFHAKGVRFGGYKDRLQWLAFPDPLLLEAAVAEERYTDADAVMAGVGLAAPKLKPGCPRLQWRNGSDLSDGAQGWYLANLLCARAVVTDKSVVAREATLVVDPGLSDTSCTKFAAWIAVQKLGSSLKCTAPTGKEAVVNELGRMRQSGTLKRRLSQIRGIVGAQGSVNRAIRSPRVVDVRGVGGTLAFVRWTHRLKEDFTALHNLQAKDYDLLVEKHWPSGDDPSGSSEEWLGEMNAIIDRAIRDGRAMSGAHFHAVYLSNALARRALDGRTVKIGDETVALTSAELSVDPEARVVFVRMTPSSQRLGLDDIPALPDIMPNATFKKRIKAAGLRAYQETGGGTVKASLDVGRFRLTAFHDGYGAGYGGASPVVIRGYEVVELGDHAPKKAVCDPNKSGSQELRGFEALSPEVLHHVIEILIPLFAPPPKVSASNPAMILRSLESFVGTTKCKRYRIVIASPGVAATLKSGPGLEERLLAYAAAASELGAAKMVIHKDRTSLFGGAPEALAGQLPTVVEALANSSYELEAVGKEGRLHVLDRLPLTLRPMVPVVKAGKKAGQFVWLQADPVDRSSLDMNADAPVQAIKEQLNDLVQSTKAGSYQVSVDGAVLKAGLKAKRLKKMATTIRASLKAGKTVRVSPEGNEGPSEGAHVEL